MAVLTYWVAECLGDAQCYCVVGKTRKAVLEDLKNYGADGYGPPVKRKIEYKDAFDLFQWVTSEGGGRMCGTE